MQYFLLVLVGAITGILGGMLGIGGSIIMIPAMVLILGATAAGADGAKHEMIHQYMAAAMIVNFFLSIPAVAAHWKNKAIWPKVVIPLIIGGLLGVVGGVQLSWLFVGKTAEYLRWFLGAFFIYVAMENIYRAIRGPKDDRAGREDIEKGSWIPKFGIGASVGAFAGLTGLGGGALAVPAQQYILNMRLRNAIANSSAFIASVSWLGAITKNMQLAANSSGTLKESLLLAACLTPTAMIGSYIGGHLTHRLPVQVVRITFATLILASTWKMFAG